MPLRRIAVALAVGLALLLAAAGVRTVGHGRAANGGAGAAGALASAAARLPRPERPAFVVGTPVPLRKGEMRAHFAPVLRQVAARARPSAHAPVVAGVPLLTEEGTTNLVLVLSQQTRANGEWVHVRLPVLPNNLTAWVPRSALGGYRFIHTRLVVDREDFEAILYYERRPVFRAPVGVGRADSPTPTGEFYIREKLMGFGDPFYGPVAFGTSARSEVLTDWPGGGFIGIHGTNEPQLIPGRISHGCIRLRNADILRLSRLMPVGTPLSIR
jgi:lipoprotein-anchoring transpeptidase ErfK/SrfK